MGLRSSEPHHETLKSSTSKIPTEREMHTRTQTDDKDLHVSVKMGTLLSGETKDDEFHQGSDARGVFRSRIVGMS